MTRPTVPHDDPPPLEVLDIGTATAPDPQTGESADAGPWRWATAAVIVVVTSVSVAWVATRPTAPVVASPPPPTPAISAPATPVGVDGFAEMYVATYLTADGEGGAAALGRFYPSAPDTGTGGGLRFVTRTATTSVRTVADDYWVVGVAADVLTSDGVGWVADPTHHYTVGLVVAGDGFAATGLPVRVAAPPPAAIPAVTEGVPVEDTGLRTVVEGFVLAHAAGEGDIATFIASDAGIRPVSPAPYTSIAFDSLNVVDLDDTRRLVRVTALGSIEHGMRRPIEYHVTVVTENGALRVASIAPGAALRPQPQPSSPIEPSTDPGGE